MMQAHGHQEKRGENQFILHSTRNITCTVLLIFLPISCIHMSYIFYSQKICLSRNGETESNSMLFYLEKTIRYELFLSTFVLLFSLLSCLLISSSILCCKKDNFNIYLIVWTLTYYLYYYTLARPNKSFFFNPKRLQFVHRVWDKMEAIKQGESADGVICDTSDRRQARQCDKALSCSLNTASAGWQAT